MSTRDRHRCVPLLLQAARLSRICHHRTSNNMGLRADGSSCSCDKGTLLPTAYHASFAWETPPEAKVGYDHRLSRKSINWTLVEGCALGWTIRRSRR